MTRVVLTSILLPASLGGCALHNNIVKGPDTPKALAVNSKMQSDLTTEINNFYGNDCASDPSNEDCYASNESKAQRNAIIYDLKRIIDRNYHDYSLHFEQTQDTISLAGEVSSASLTAVGTLVGATGLKDILTTASTLTQSTNISIQKNYFQKQTAYAILSAMDANRAKQWEQITNMMSEDTEDYSLKAALHDLQQYKDAGTAVAALTSLSQQASVQQKDSTDQANKNLQ
jgi:hypothetical protein